MMASISQIRTALRATIQEAIPTLRGYDKVEDATESPCFIVYPREADFTGAFNRGLDDWDFDVYVMVNRSGDGGYAQEVLDAYITGAGSKSIRQALFNKPDLGLAATDAFVKGVKGYGGEFQVAKIPHVGAILKVCVRTDGSQ